MKKLFKWFAIATAVIGAVFLVFRFSKDFHRKYITCYK